LQPVYFYYWLCVNRDLTSNREDWLGWLRDLRGDTRDANIDNNRQECCQEGGESVVHTTVLVNLDDLVDNPSNQVHPRKGGGEGKASNNGVEGLGFEFSSNESDSFSGDSGHFFYTLS